MPDGLADKICTPCRGGVPPLTREEAERYLDLVRDWELLDDARLIRRTYRFGNFWEALTFAGKIGELAEAEGRHHGPRLVTAVA
jgi:4a-hydroxytetrahydrobiopterin dehydratase